MAITSAIQTLIDGPRNVVAKVTGDALQNDAFTPLTILDPAQLTSMMPGFPGGGLGPQLLRVDRIEFALSDGIAIQLFWDATTPILITELSGRGKVDPKHYGGFWNNAGAGDTGKITYKVISIDTTSVTAQPVTWTLLLSCVKQLFAKGQGA